MDVKNFGALAADTDPTTSGQNYAPALWDETGQLLLFGNLGSHVETLTAQAPSILADSVSVETLET